MMTIGYQFIQGSSHQEVIRFHKHPRIFLKVLEAETKWRFGEKNDVPFGHWMIFR